MHTNISLRFFTAILLSVLLTASVCWSAAPDAAALADNSNRLLFQWDNAKMPVRVQNYDGTPVFERFYAPTARGLATYDHNYAMWMYGGAYLCENIATPMAAAFRESNQFTMEISLKPSDIIQNGAVIAAMASENGINCILSQEKEKLIFRISTDKENEQVMPICPVAMGEICHLIISYRPGELMLFKNGVLIAVNNKITGELKNWKNQPLIFGNDTALKHPWYGKIEGIRLYARAIKQEEAKKNYAAYNKIIKARKTVPQLIIQAKLLKRSDIQSSKAILPYTQALAMYEYAVEKVIAGKYSQKKIRVAHWVILDKQLLPQANFPLNKSCRLTLEPFDENPQLEASLMNDTLPFDVEIGQYFDIRLVRK